MLKHHSDNRRVGTSWTVLGFYDVFNGWKGGKYYSGKIYGIRIFNDCNATLYPNNVLAVSIGMRLKNNYVTPAGLHALIKPGEHREWEYPYSFSAVNNNGKVEVGDDDCWYVWEKFRQLVPDPTNPLAFGPCDQRMEVWGEVIARA